MISGELGDFQQSPCSLRVLPACEADLVHGNMSSLSSLSLSPQGVEVPLNECVCLCVLNYFFAPRQS